MPIIPGYEVTGLIGRGGMGRVYRAVDQRLGRTVAVKMLLDAEDSELLSRFESEARAVASLSHPNIIRLFEFAKTESGQPFCAVCYSWCRRAGAFGVKMVFVAPNNTYSEYCSSFKWRYDWQKQSG